MAMAGHVARTGGAVLAALTIVAGGALAGVGSAGAQSSEDGFQGSVGDLLYDLTITGFPPCEPVSQDNMPCDDGRFDNGMVTVGNIKVDLDGPNELNLGDTAQITAYLWESPPYGVDLSKEPETQITSATVRVPRGFVFTGGEVSSGPTQVFDATFVVDPATGDVTATAPTNGWTIPRFQAANGVYHSRGIGVKLNFEATEYVYRGESAVRFSGTGVPSSDWVQTGETRVLPEPVASIASGSSVGSSEIFDSVAGS